MTRIVESEENLQAKKRRRRIHIKSSSVFVFVMLFYSVAHFALMWVGVNFNSFALSFERYSESTGTYKFVGFDNLFLNFQRVFDAVKTNLDFYGDMIPASLAFFVVSCFVTLPIALFFSYFIFKKILANGFFKIIFFLPSVIPLIILTTIFSISVKDTGPVGQLLLKLGVPSDTFFVTSATSKWLIWIFCVWAGIGYDVILLTAGMSRIPRDILESCKMDGVPTFKEFIHIVIPLTWSTITTLFVFGMMSVFTVFLQPLYLDSVHKEVWTIGTHIYNESTAIDGYSRPAALGILCSLIGAPIIVGVRALLNRFFREVSY